MARFDHVIESSKVGVRKPELAFYELACTTAGVEPPEVVFLDDLGINLKPAKAMGMTTIKVVSPEQAIADLEMTLGSSSSLHLLTLNRTGRTTWHLGSLLGWDCRRRRGGRGHDAGVAGERCHLLGDEAHDEIVERQLLVVGAVDVGRRAGRGAAGAVRQEHEPGAGRLRDLAEHCLGLVVGLRRGDREDLDPAARRRERIDSS